MTHPQNVLGGNMIVEQIYSSLMAFLVQLTLVFNGGCGRNEWKSEDTVQNSTIISDAATPVFSMADFISDSAALRSG